MVEIKENTISIIEKKINRKISYSSISPSLFMFLEFRDFKVLENSRELLEINKIRVYYSFLDLLRGQVIDSLKEIRIIKSTFNFNYEEDSDLIQLLKTINNSQKSSANFPDIKFSGRNLRLTVTRGNQSVTIKKLFFNISHKNQVVKYIVKGAVNTFPTDMPFLEGSTEFLLSGTMNDTLDDISTRIVLKSLTNKYFTIDKLSLKISYKNGLIFLRKIEDERPMDINISYSPEKKEINLSFISEEFKPLSYFTPRNINPSVLQWLSSSITGNIDLNYSIETGNSNYTADFRAKINNTNIPVPLLLDTSLSGNNGNVEFSKLKIMSKDGYFTYQGFFNYKDLSTKGNFLINYTVDKTKISARFYLNKKDNNFNIQGKDILVNETKIFNFKADLILYRNDIDFQSTFSLLESLEENEDNIPAHISIDGNFQFKPEIFLNVNINSINTPMNTFLSLIPDNNKQLLSFIPDLTLNSNIFLSTDFNKFSFSTQEIAVKAGKNSISFSAFGNNNSISINNLIINWNGNQIDSSIEIVVNQNFVSITADALFKDFQYTVQADYYPDTGLFIEGNHGLAGSFIFMKNFTEISLKFKDLPVPISQKPTEISLDTEGYIFKTNDWELVLKNFEITNLPGIISDNNIRLAGFLSRNRINITSVIYNDPLSHLTGKGDFTYDLNRKKELAGILIFDSEGDESYNVDINIVNKKIKLKAVFVDSQINRFKNLPLTGSLSGDLSINGLLPNPDIDIEVQLNKGSYRSSPLEIETSILLKDKKLKLNYLRLNYQKQTLQKGSGEYDIATGFFYGSTELHGLFNEKTITSSIDFKGNTSVFYEKINFPLLLKNNYNVEFNINNIFVDTKKTDSWIFQISRDGDNVSFKGGPNNSLDGLLNDNGEFRIISRVGLPVRAYAEGKLKDDHITVNIENIEVDLKLLNLIPTSGYLKFTEGTAKGNLSITGPLVNPSFYGSFHASGVEAGVSLLADKIDPFNTSIYFSDKTMTIGPETIRINNSFAQVSADFIIEKWIPGTYSVEVKVPEDSGIHVIYDLPGIGLGLDGLINGDLKLFGNKEMFSINSDLVVDDCIIGIGQKESIERSNNSALSIDMKFTTGRDVQFIWPSKTLPILQATAQSDQIITFSLDSLSNTFSVKGDIKVKHGGINYFQKSFYLTKGSILFNESELKFDPILDFTAKIKEVDSRGEVVNISLILDQTPLSQFEPKFESDPPLTDVEIFSILGTGIFTEIGTEKIDLTSALLLTSDLVTQFGIIQSFEKKVKNIFNLDLFSIRTQMIQNILIDRFIQDSSQLPDGRLDSFGSYLNNTTLYLGKYFGNDIFLQALLQISNEQLSSAGQMSTTDELLIESTISLEWQTPFFLLGFSVKPDFNDPLSSIQNTSLKLSWDYSY